MDAEARARTVEQIRERWKHSALRPGEPAYTRASEDIPALLAAYDDILAERDALAAECAHLKNVMRFGLGDPLCGIVSNSGPNGEPLACAWPPHGAERTHSWATLPTYEAERAPVAAVLAAADALVRAFYPTPEYSRAARQLEAAIAAWRAARGEPRRSFSPIDACPNCSAPCSIGECSASCGWRAVRGETR